jgi:hypothetical protein
MANDTDGIPKSADHIGPGAYLHLEKLHPYTLTLATLWRCGHQTLEVKHSWITAILSCICETPNASILAPYGQNLVTNGLQNEYDLDEIEEVLPPSQSNGPLPHMLQSQETLGMQDLKDTAAED